MVIPPTTHLMHRLIIIIFSQIIHVVRLSGLSGNTLSVHFTDDEMRKQMIFSLKPHGMEIKRPVNSSLCAASILYQSDHGRSIGARL